MISHHLDTVHNHCSQGEDAGCDQYFLNDWAVSNSSKLLLVNLIQWITSILSRFLIHYNMLHFNGNCDYKSKSWCRGKEYCWVWTDKALVTTFVRASTGDLRVDFNKKYCKTCNCILRFGCWTITTVSLQDLKTYAALALHIRNPGKITVRFELHEWRKEILLDPLVTRSLTASRMCWPSTYQLNAQYIYVLLTSSVH